MWRKMRIANLIVLSLVAALGYSPFGSPAKATGAADFIGPFLSWANVKTHFGARGDGLADDTAAIQAALDQLGPSTATIYFPAGTYRVTDTLRLSKRIHVNLIGDGSASTKIIWDGKTENPTSAILRLDGLAYSRIDRLTFDGRERVHAAVDESWSGNADYFDTGNEFADDVMENAEIGFLCGDKGYGCAETAILRDQFVGNSVAGISMKNFNALDMFIWNSRFEKNAVGVTNEPGAGNFHIFESYFGRSRSADISIGNTGLFNFRNNLSVGSAQFLNAAPTGNPANITLQKNTIVDTTSPLSLSIGNFGPVILLDNVVRSTPSHLGPVVNVAPSGMRDFFSLGNVFTVPSAIPASGRYHAMDDVVVQRDAPNVAEPGSTAILDRTGPAIFDVPAGSSAAQIQQVIDRAASSRDANPVVHIAAGSYAIDDTLNLPAGRRILIVGDGYQSHLVWNGPGTGPVIRLKGPSLGVLREFSIDGNARKADGIEVDNADQPRSRIYMESPFLVGSFTNLLVDRLDNTNVELHDFEHSGAQNLANNAVSLNVVGGPLASSGHWQGGATHIFAGGSSGNNVSYRTSGGAHLSVQDAWNDAGGGGGQLIGDIAGNGAFYYAGSMLYQPRCTPYSAIAFHDFHGSAALLNLNVSCSISIGENDAGAELAVIGLVSYQRQGIVGKLGQLKRVVVWNGQTTYSPPPGNGSSQVPEQGIADKAFLQSVLGQARSEKPTVLSALSKGATDVRIYRVFVDHANIGIRLTASVTGNGSSAD